MLRSFRRVGHASPTHRDQLKSPHRSILINNDNAVNAAKWMGWGTKPIKTTFLPFKYLSCYLSVNPNDFLASFMKWNLSILIPQSRSHPACRIFFGIVRGIVFIPEFVFGQQVVFHLLTFIKREFLNDGYGICCSFHYGSGCWDTSTSWSKKMCW